MSDKKSAIIVENVWKQYGVETPKIFEKVKDVSYSLFLKNDIALDKLWALKDISFQVKKGETFGIIGRNGAGKSTLLKLLSGVSTPTIGRIVTKGSIFPMIELNAGMHIDFTGRENVHVLGTIMGLSKKKIEEIMGDIEDFCELGEWFDRPVRYYSSGMTARLGFSVGVNVDAEIILIDEVLSVGDLPFSLKCHRKISELREKGVTILFVSHSLQAVKNTCTRAMWIENGSIREIGDVHVVCTAYSSEMIQRSRNYAIDTQQIIQFDENINISVEIWDVNYSKKNVFKNREPINIAIFYNAKRTIRKPIIIVNIYTSDNIAITSHYTSFDKKQIPDFCGHGLFVYQLHNHNLNPGKYLISIIIAEKEIQSNLIWHEKAYVFNIIDSINSYGIVNIPHEWHHYPQITENVYQDIKSSMRSSFFKQIIKPGDLCFDIGANVGEVSKVLLDIGAKVIAVEPQNQCIIKIKENIGENPNLTILDSGVSSKDGELDFFICPDAPTISTFSKKWKVGRFENFHWTETKKVKVTTLDNLIGMFGLPKYCKIDVEGSEIDVLKGLSHAIPMISFEFCIEFIDDAINCIKILEKIGYTQFNFSLYEKYFFESDVWLASQNIVLQINRIYNPLLWGDIYAKN